MTKRVDTTRPVIDTSGYSHVETDILDIPRTFLHSATGMRPLREGNPIDASPDLVDEAYGPELSYVSEFGGIWGHPDQDAGWGYGERPADQTEFIERFRGLTDVLLDNPGIGLFCYTQLYDIEQEVNGLYTANVNRKSILPSSARLPNGPQRSNRREPSLPRTMDAGYG